MSANVFEKLSLLEKNGEFDEVSVIGNVLRCLDGELKIVKVLEPMKGKLIITDFKFFLLLGKHRLNVHLAFADYDMMEFVYIDKLPQKLVVFDVEIPVPF